jgi:hypothetical protein
MGQQQINELLRDVVHGWKEQRRLDGVLLQALIDLSLQSPERAAEGFTAPELADAIRLVIGRRWAGGDTDDVISDKVRTQWNNLVQKLWPQKEEGIIQRCQDAGLDARPSLVRSTGGGTGNPTRYRMEALPLAESAPQYPESAVRLQDGCLRYICEDIENAGWIAKLFASGFRVIGWRRWVLVALYIVFTLVTVFAIVLTFAVLQMPPPARDLSGWFFTLLIFFLAAWTTMGPLSNLPERRVAMAPWWIQLFDDDRVIEWRAPPKYESKEIKAVRYTSVCPICGGKVVIRGGGFEYWGRLIGRCSESPREHVYSFDHVTRQGRSLRA